MSLWQDGDYGQEPNDYKERHSTPMKFILEVDIDDGVPADSLAASLRMVANNLQHGGFDNAYQGVPDEHGYTIGKWFVEGQG